MASEVNPLSELQLGIRELFRILFPGVYALLLLAVLASGTELVQSFTSSNARLSAAVLLLGVIGYGLRAHECWWPYSRVFEVYRKQLNVKIQAVSDLTGPDLKAEYKYFLTTGSRDVADRVHYFSSFYYMLVTLSLYSLFAAGTEVFVPAFSKALDLGLHGPRWISVTLLLVGLLSQLVQMHITGVSGRSGELNKTLRLILEIAPAAATSLAAAVLLIPLALDSVVPSASLTARVCMPLILSFVFANLGNKQWRSIIEEQIVHVGHNRSAFASSAHE